MSLAKSVDHVEIWDQLNGDGRITANRAFIATLWNSSAVDNSEAQYNGVGRAHLTVMVTRGSEEEKTSFTRVLLPLRSVINTHSTVSNLTRTVTRHLPRQGGDINIQYGSILNLFRSRQGFRRLQLFPCYTIAR
jgi:hypothetical protein